MHGLAVGRAEVESPSRPGHKDRALPNYHGPRVRHRDAPPDRGAAERLPLAQKVQYRFRVARYAGRHQCLHQLLEDRWLPFGLQIREIQAGAE